MQVAQAINAGFAVYDGYKAYKSGATAMDLIGAAALGAVGGAKAFRCYA